MDEDEPIPSSSKPILHTSDINSLLDLKTEYLLRKKAAVSAVSQNHSAQVNSTGKSKNNVLAITKQEKKSKSDAQEARRARIKGNEEALRKEEEDRFRRAKILNEKAAIYERMSKGETELIHEDGTMAEFLVNFHQKKKEMDEAALSADNKQDETEEGRPREAVNPLIVHYDHTEEKGRVFGPSHVKLSYLDEEQRQAQIDEIKRLSEETAVNRAKRKKVVDAKKAADRERLNRIRARKGLPLLEASSDEEEEETEAPDLSLIDIPLPPNPCPETKPEAPPVKKPKYGVREWDKGKTSYNRWIEKERSERDDEFRPPSSYYS